MAERRRWRDGVIGAGVCVALALGGCGAGGGEDRLEAGRGGVADGVEAPGGLDEQSYERLLLEVMVTHQLYDTMADSARVDSAKRELMERNGTTWEAFLATHSRYEEDVEAQIDRISRLQDRVQREMQRITAYQRGDPGAREEAARRLRQAEQTEQLQGLEQMQKDSAAVEVTPSLP